MQLTTLKAQSRKLTDSRANVRMRKQGLVPAVYYGQGQEPQHVSVDATVLRNVFAPGKRYSLLDLEIDGKAGNPAIIHDYQKDAISLAITHIDFLKIDETSLVKVRVPIRLEGLPIGVKSEGGLLQQEKRYINLAVKPTEIPAELLINVEDCHAGATFYAKDLKIGNAKLVSQGKTAIFTISKKSRGEEKEAAAAAAAPAAKAAAAPAKKDDAKPAAGAGAAAAAAPAKAPAKKK